MTQMTKAWKNHLMPPMLPQNLKRLIHLDHRSHHRGLYTQDGQDGLITVFLLKMVSRVRVLSTEGKAKRSNKKRCQSSRDPLFLFWLYLCIYIYIYIYGSFRLGQLSHMHLARVPDDCISGPQICAACETQRFYFCPRCCDWKKIA